MAPDKRHKAGDERELSERSLLMKTLTIIEDLILNGEQSLQDDEVCSLPVGDTEKEVLCRIIGELTQLQQFGFELSRGQLDTNLPMRGYTAANLKVLQEKLCHLTWQTKLIAAGDLSQRIEFMGEFADSVNKMTSALHEFGNEIHRKEERLTQANHQLMVMSSITRHDIMNLIMAILGYAEIAREDIHDPRIIEYFRKIEIATREIQSHLEFTRLYEAIGVNEPGWIKPAALCSRLKIPPAIAFTCESDDVEVYADPMFETAFINLLDNSLRHGQTVTRLCLKSCKDADRFRLTWQDNGIGVPCHEKEFIFKRGYGKNAGLSLFLVREILALTSIDISETGVPGSGACFEMIVPAGGWRYPDNSDRL